MQKFDIGPELTQTRVGLLTFGHQVWKKFDLKDKMDEQELLQAVKAIEHGRGRTTKTADAIDFAVDNMFTERAGSRRDVAHIAVVVTDGRSQETRKTSKAAKHVSVFIEIFDERVHHGKCFKVLSIISLSKGHTQKAQIQIRLLRQNQSDQCLLCLLFR